MRIPVKVYERFPQLEGGNLMFCGIDCPVEFDELGQGYIVGTV